MLANGLTFFTIPQGQGFIRVYGRTPAQVEIDYYIERDKLIQLIYEQLGVRFVLDGVRARVRSPLWEFNRRLNQVNTIQAKPIVYPVLQTFQDS